jgi:hypothetical protein
MSQHPSEPDEPAIALTSSLYRRLYEIVREAGPYGITWRDLADKLYARRADGGPTSNCIKQIICQRINPRIAEYGIKIHRGTGQSFYRLVPR